MRTLKRKLKNFLIAKHAFLKCKILGAHGIAILCKTQQGIFLVDPEDAGVGGELLKTGSYGDVEIASILSESGPDDKILIVGAHIGALLVPIARSVHSVCGVEANPDTFQLLSLNVSLNHLANVEIAQVAASNKREKLTFLKNRVNSGGSKRKPFSYSQDYYFDNPEVVEVDAISLDEKYDQTFQHIIMDIEGSEVFALRGMPRILADAKSLRIEFLPHHLKDVANVTVAEFLEPIQQNFNHLTIPSQNVTVDRDAFLSTLQKMFDADIGEDSLIFRKKNLL